MPDDIGPVISVEEGPLRQMHARRFRASSFTDDCDVLLRVVTERALAWIEAREDAAPLRIEYHFHDSGDPAADQRRGPEDRLLGAILDSSWTVDAVLYYEGGPE